MSFFRKKHHNSLNNSFILSYKIISCLILLVVFFHSARAEITSTSYQLENPINIIGGGQASSSSFQYVGSTGQITGGQSTSSNFVQNIGFLYFPTATSPVVSATAGNAQVVLSWTASVGTLADITSYQLGTSTTSGGSFTYESLGEVLTSTKTGLSNGTTYYFKIRSYAAGLLLSESAEVSATPVAPVVNNGGGGGGGGGGGASIDITPDTGVVFSGRAYPLSKVSILKDGQLVLSTIAGPDSKFTASLNNLSSGTYNFSVYGEDKDGLRSTPFTFQVFITSGVVTQIGGIFIAPTIAVDKSEVKKGENISIFGQSTPVADVVISVNSPQEFFRNASTDQDGVYLHNFDTSVLELGAHSTKSKALKDGEISSFGATISFKVGNKNVFADKKDKLTKCDLNEDSRCNLVDFSVAAYWYKRTLSTEFIPREVKYLNGDGKVDLVDFSIMAFYWTG